MAKKTNNLYDEFAPRNWRKELRSLEVRLNAQFFAI